MSLVTPEMVAAFLGPRASKSKSPARKMIEEMRTQMERTTHCHVCLSQRGTFRRDGEDESGKRKYICTPCGKSRTRVVNGGSLV